MTPERRRRHKGEEEREVLGPSARAEDVPETGRDDLIPIDDDE